MKLLVTLTCIGMLTPPAGYMLFLSGDGRAAAHVEARASAAEIAARKRRQQAAQLDVARRDAPQAPATASARVVDEPWPAAIRKPAPSWPLRGSLVATAAHPAISADGQ